MEKGCTNSVRSNALCSMGLVKVGLWVLHISSAFGLKVRSDTFSCSGNDTCALRQFREKLLHGGEPALASWRSTDVRLWKGVTWQVDPHGEYQAVRLELGGLELKVKAGTHDIAPLLTDGLASLEVLNLSGNMFNAMLPRTLRVCPPLQVLDVSNGRFHGSLPSNMICADHRAQLPDETNLISQQKLRVFNLSHNNLTGDGLGYLFSYESTAVLGHLSHVNLASNSLSGNVPSSLANCTSLAELSLSSNLLTGEFSVPLQELGKLPLLQTLDLTNSSLSGNLPPVIAAGVFSNLRSLLLGNNELTGSIPEDFGNLSSLVVLDLAVNVLVGEIPKVFGNLSRIKTLDLSDNNLTGAIPESLGKLSSLETLNLSENNVRGAMPGALSKLTNLKILDLHQNSVSKFVSESEIMQLTSLQVLNLSNNRMRASATILAPLLSNCTNLQILWLGDNLISGSLPREFGNATNLEVISLYANDFEGTLPAELGHLSRAQAFDVSYNRFSGGTPSQLCTLALAGYFSLGHNYLSGPIPHCFGNFSNVRVFDLSNNSLTGEIPSEIGNLSSSVEYDDTDRLPDLATNTVITWGLLRYQGLRSPVILDLSSSFFSEGLPESLGRLGHVQELYSNNNSLSGEIPPTLGSMSSLSLLDLSRNNLRGRIPTELTQLSFQCQLNLSHNVLLEGPVADTGQFATFGGLSYLGDDHDPI